MCNAALSACDVGGGFSNEIETDRTAGKVQMEFLLQFLRQKWAAHTRREALH